MDAFCAAYFAGLVDVAVEVAFPTESRITNYKAISNIKSPLFCSGWRAISPFAEQTRELSSAAVIEDTAGERLI